MNSHAPFGADVMSPECVTPDPRKEVHDTCPKGLKSSLKNKHDKSTSAREMDTGLPSKSVPCSLQYTNRRATEPSAGKREPRASVFNARLAERCANGTKVFFSAGSIHTLPIRGI